MRAGMLLLSGLVCAAVGGCPTQQRQTSVRLKNDTGSTLTVRVVYDDDQEIPEELLEESTEIEFVIPAGGSESFSRDCDDLQAVKIARADVNLVAGFGPSASSRVYRDGDDFGCGDLITFTFTLNLVDLNISFSQQDR